MLKCFSCVWLFVTLWTVATRLLCPWDSPGKNTGVGCHTLLQGIFLTQGLNPCLLHCRQILYCWATREALGTGLHSRKWAVGEWAKLRLYLQLLPITHITTWAPPPVRSAVTLHFHRNSHPTVTISHHPQMGPSSCRKTSSGLPPFLHYGELYNYLITYHSVIIIEIKFTVNVIRLNHPKSISPTLCRGKTVFHKTCP